MKWLERGRTWLWVGCFLLLAKCYKKDVDLVVKNLTNMQTEMEESQIEVHKELEKSSDPDLSNSEW